MVIDELQCIIVVDIVFRNTAGPLECAVNLVDRVRFEINCDLFSFTVMTVISSPGVCI